MSQFEFVSVAVALLYAIAIGRLLTALPDLFDARRRYWVAQGWAIYLLLFCLSTWFGFWDWRDFEFDPATFLGALAPPAFVIVRVELLCGRASREIEDYRAHYYAIRVPFFAVGLVSMTFLFFSPWVAGQLPWGTFTSFHALGATSIAVWIAGIVSDRPALHGGLVVFQVFGTLAQYFLGVA